VACAAERALRRRRSLKAMGIAGAYRLGPESGRLLVHTTRTGLGAKAGHDLTLEVTRWHGRATVDPATPANSSVTVEVDADSLEVRKGTGGVKPLSDADRAEIHKTLKAILRTGQHPTITFRSRQVDGFAASFACDGELTIMGVTQPVMVQGRVADWPGRWWGECRPEPMGHPALLGVLWRPQAQRRGQCRRRRGPHAERLTRQFGVMLPGLSSPCIPRRSRS
jgi:polyisoprenoid-binding protein YceI